MWHELPADRQEILAELIEVTDDASELIKRLMSSPWNFSQNRPKQQAVASCRRISAALAARRYSG